MNADKPNSSLLFSIGVHLRSSAASYVSPFFNSLFSVQRRTSVRRRESTNSNGGSAGVSGAATKPTCGEAALWHRSSLRETSGFADNLRNAFTRV